MTTDLTESPSRSFRAFEAATSGDSSQRGVTTLTLDALPADGALIKVQWSSVNYKDALAASPTGRVARISPLVPGIDLAGTLLDDIDGLRAGDAVIAHGYDIGVGRHGGFAQYARVPAEWLVPLPPGLDLRDAMAIGTAGFTAALSVVALEGLGLDASDGPVLVTGATGGVGSVAVGILAERGYEVIGATGKPAAADYLRELGASSVIDRATLSEPGKALEPMKWAAAVDCVGGTTLASVLARTMYGGAVAASGLTGGADLPTTVMPFILRGVSLLGIDSVQTPIDRRRAIWQRLAQDLKPPRLSVMAHDVGLDGIEEALSAILAGAMIGRTVVDLES